MADTLRQACQELWSLDHNRLQPGRDYAINLQDGKQRRNDADAAVQPLFSFVNEDIWQRPTYRLFQALLDNYHREEGIAEHLTNQQKQEVSDFLDAVIGTQPMLFVHQQLSAMGRADHDLRGFKQQLWQMWFSTYRRVVDNDSSGFEHVFVGETDHGETKGFHNWVQYWLQERNGQEMMCRLHFCGIEPAVSGSCMVVRRGEGLEHTGPDERIINIQFGWGGDVKPVSTLFVATSPEFDMALYTLCFCAGEQENFVHLGDYEVKIRCYRIHSKYGDKVGSSFPELVSKTPGSGQNGYAALAPPSATSADGTFASGYPPASSSFAPQSQPPGPTYPQQQQPQGMSYAAAAGGHQQQAYGQPNATFQQQQQQQQSAYQQGGPGQNGPPADAAQQGCMGKLLDLLKAIFK